MAFTPVIKNNKKVILDQVSYIHYPVWYKKDEIRALINFGSKINVITPVYISQLSFQVRYTNIKAQKIDNSIFKTFKIVFASC